MMSMVRLALVACCVSAALAISFGAAAALWVLHEAKGSRAVYCRTESASGSTFGVDAGSSEGGRPQFKPGKLMRNVSSPTDTGARVPQVGQPLDALGLAELRAEALRSRAKRSTLEAEDSRPPGSHHRPWLDFHAGQASHGRVIQGSRWSRLASRTCGHHPRARCSIWRSKEKRAHHSGDAESALPGGYRA